MDNILIKLNYKKWETETSEFSNNGTSIIEKWQKRITKDEYPLCELNDKLFININKNIIILNDVENISYEVYITAETNDIWSNLNYYSLSIKDIDKIGGISVIEYNLLELWKLNYKLINKKG